MNCLALLVLLDAFRPDYLWRTEFLRGLARQAGVGAVEEPFGFVPRAAYFGGLTPNQYGFAHMFARSPWRSPFPALPGLARVAALDDPRALRARITTDATMRLPDFGARYVDGFELPLGDLASHAVVETQPPWGPRCGYRSLFHVLDDEGLRWSQCAWPYTRVVPTADPGIVARCLDGLDATTRFAFVHLSALDAIGHRDGPGAPALQHALADIDAACALLFDELHARYDRVRILFFGDHGMVTVVRTVDLRAELAAAGLVPGDGFELFVDSPMARFWFTTGAARRAVAQALNRHAAGRLLTDADLARFDAHRMDRANGEAYFVAHPGVVFAPSAFQAEGAAVRGMHGYLPDVPDNRGLLLLYDSADRTAGALGVAPATRIYPTCLAMCGLDPAAFTALAPLQVRPDPARWTSGGVAAHEARVAADIAVMRSVVTAHAPLSATVLTGSFGRGEGGVVEDGGGRASALNDYDLVVVGPDAGAAAGLGPSLARRLDVDFCDVMPTAALTGLPPSQFHFDLRWGSQVIAGDRRALAALPHYAPGDIPVADAARLLLNRVAGVLLVPLPTQRGEGPLDQFAVNQVGKALVAAGDACLLRVGDYSPRLADRAARFAALAGVLDCDDRWVARVVAAYSYRQAPTPAPGPFTAADFGVVRAAVPAVLATIAASLSTVPEGDDAAWAAAIATALAPIDDPAADQAYVAARLRALGWTPMVSGTGLRRSILEGQVALFRTPLTACRCAIDLEAWSERLMRLGVDAAGLVSLPGDWLEYARRHLATAWLATCHG